MTSFARNGRLPGITLWTLDLDQPLPSGPALQVPAVFTRAGAREEAVLAQAMGYADATVVMQRLERGRLGYIGYIAGTLASYGWVTFDTEAIGEVGLTIHLQSDEAYIWHCATLPNHRGQRLYSALLLHIAGDLQRMHLHRAWIGTDNANLPSQNGTMLAGFQPIVEVIASPGARVHHLRRWLTAPEQLVSAARSALLGTDQAIPFLESNDQMPN